MTFPDLTGITVPGAPWTQLAVAAVLALAAVLTLVSAARRVVRAVRGRTAVADPDATVRRLKKVRAVAVLAVGAIGMGVAAIGTVRALTELGQPLFLAIPTSAAIEGGALALATDLYLRIRDGHPATRARVASWAFALASAFANGTHPPTTGTDTTGAVIFGLLPLLSLYLIEYQATADHDPADATERAAWPLRVARAAWRRAWTGLATGLGLDVNATDSDTERELAVRRAARATYRLRLAKQIHTEDPSKRTAARLRRRTRTAQAARERAQVATDADQALRLARLMRELVLGADDAAGDWSDVTAAARRIYGAPIPGAPATTTAPPTTATETDAALKVRRTAKPRRGRRALTPEELTAKAVELDAAYRQENGRPIPAQKLADALRIGKPRANALTEQIRAEHDTADHDDRPLTAVR